MTNDGRTIGIDLGTTNSAMAVMTLDEPEIIPNEEGDRTTPSVVTFDEDGDITVGKEAVNQAVMRPDRTVEQVKREMDNDEWRINIDGDAYDAQQISALILDKLTTDAGDFLDSTVDSAVITVPAYFSEKERQATKNAGEIAGLDVEHILPEPSAACLAYGLHEAKQNQEAGEKEVVFVYDLGGGTFDATLVDVAGDYSMIETLHTDGDHDLGGEDWTNRIVEWVAEQIEDDTGFNLSDDKEQLSRVRDAAKDAKHTLSQSDSANIAVPYVVPDQGYNLDVELTRDTFHDLTSDLLEDTLACCDNLFDRADYAPSDVEKVLLVGGSTRMPQVEDAVTDYFGQDPSKEINPDEAVAIGAAMQADIIQTGGQSAANLLPGDASNVVLVDVVPQTLGVELADGTMDPLIPQDDPIPTEEDDHYTNAHDGQEVVNVRVFQGEHHEEADNEANTYIGNLKLDIEPQPARNANIRVTFSLDEDGTLNVAAVDEDTGEVVETTFESVFHMSDAEIDEKRAALPNLG